VRSIGEDRKIERKRGVGGLIGKGLKGGGVTRGVIRQRLPKPERERERNQWRRSCRQVGPVGQREREGSGAGLPSRAGSAGLGPGHGPGGLMPLLFSFFCSVFFFFCFLFF
jgi:hypothetical protein